jgi:uridylate kinase
MGNNGYTEKIIISLGGSLVVPKSGIDTDFLTKFNQFVRNKLAENKNRQFFLVVGGGATARQYRDAGMAVIGGALPMDDMDWLGIHATRVNAHLVRTIFKDIAHPSIIEHYDIIRKATEPVVVASGWKPGWSTDYCAVLLAEDYGAKTIINLSNIKQVYDKDPKEFPDAKPIEHMTWPEFRQLVGDEWSPGMNAPFDPIAAKKAEELGVKVVVLDGHEFENLENEFENREFVGTVIE